jgi:hypothetical protein
MSNFSNSLIKTGSLSPSGSYTINLPNNMVDGRIIFIFIKSNTNISSISFVPSVEGYTGNSNATLIYSAVTNKWYSI